MSAEQHRPTSQRAGFSLIEILISIALALVILLTAFAGFRATAALVSSSNRIARDNQMFRSGYFQALEELDFWTAYDNSEHQDNRRLQGGTGDFTDINTSALSNTGRPC